MSDFLISNPFKIHPFPTPKLSLLCWDIFPCPSNWVCLQWKIGRIPFKKKKWRNGGRMTFMIIIKFFFHYHITYETNLINERWYINNLMKIMKGLLWCIKISTTTQWQIKKYISFISHMIGKNLKFSKVIKYYKCLLD